MIPWAEEQKRIDDAIAQMNAVAGDNRIYKWRDGTTMGASAIMSGTNFASATTATFVGFAVPWRGLCRIDQVQEAAEWSRPEGIETEEIQGSSVTGEFTRPEIFLRGQKEIWDLVQSKWDKVWMHKGKFEPGFIAAKLGWDEYSIYRGEAYLNAVPVRARAIDGSVCDEFCSVLAGRTAIFFHTHAFLVGSPDNPFICDWPIEVHYNENRELHRDGGVAIITPDRYEGYYLNGVRVPKALALLPPSKLKPKKWLAHENVEVRREYVRKVGLERIAKQVKAKTVDGPRKHKFKQMDGDAECEYELMALDLGQGLFSDVIALKMSNPSIGTYHMEFVPPDTRTIEQALKFRCPGFGFADQLT